MDAENLLTAGSRAWSRVAGVCVLTVALALMHPGSANAKRGERGTTATKARRPTPSLIQPRRVTIGNHNHFMGVLGPNARYLYYVTDEYNAYDLFVQSPISATGKPVFEAFGDITWPAISPDGKEVAYIRYETDARGDACRRRIRRNGSARNDRQECHATDDADLQIYWGQDGRLGILTRRELHGDHILLDGAFGRHPEEKPANVVGLAVSPDERWVAYVPLARLRAEIGVSFSNHAGAEGLRIRRATEGAEELSYKPELPGISGYPVFSPDGAHLYFSQFLNDTNRDGLINGDDNGVLFRVPFYGEDDEPKFGKPRQLTNARWNCHYPSVRENVMALTCAIGDKLHIYLLPPSGIVPADWDQARIASEVETVVGPWRKLVLYQHLLVDANDDGERSAQLKALTQLHLDLREFEAAIYYGQQRSELLRADGMNDWWSELMVLLAKHGRADRELTRGRFSEEYIRESHGLGDAVQSIPTRGSADAEALKSLVLSRIFSDLGDKAAAASLLADVEIAPVRDEMVLDVAYQQFDHFYGLLADYDTRVARLREVALHPASSSMQSLRHSQGFIVLLQRGRPLDERLARLVAARADVPDASRLARALDLEIALHELTNENAKQVEQRFVELYRNTDDVHVRRYLIVTALRAAIQQGVEALQHSLLELWVQSAEENEAQRKTSTQLYQLVVLERAYGAFSAGDMETAAQYFDKARTAGDSLAGYVGWIESQLAMGSPERAGRYETDSDAVRRFVEAYLLARDLGSIESNKKLDKVVEQVKELLEPAIEADPYEPLSHLLLAHALHHRGMRNGGREDVATAVRHYLLTLDLGERQPRVRASAHSGMALAQASLGNHRRSLEDYEDRFELPMVSPEEETALLLHYARSLFHVNKPRAAIKEVKRGLSLMSSAQVTGDAAVPDPAGLLRYQPLALDRLALFELDAGRMAQSLETHAALRESLEAHPEHASNVNAVKAQARLATARLVTHDPKGALELAMNGQARLEAADPLRPDDIDRRIRPVTHEFVYDKAQLRVLLAGLEANAARQVGDLDRAQAALLVRKKAIEARYEEQEADEDLLELAHICLRLADVAQARGSFEVTKLYLEEGLARAEQHAALTGSDVSEVGFHLINGYARLHFDGGVELASYKRDLEQDLLRYYLFLSEVRNPDWERERMRLELFLTQLRMEKQQPDPG